MRSWYVRKEPCSHDCLPICRQPTAVVFNSTLEPIFKEKMLIDPREVCEKCREKYLSKGVMIINPKTCSLVVFTDEAFNCAINIPIPRSKIVFTDETVILMLLKAEQEAKQRQD